MNKQTIIDVAAASEILHKLSSQRVFITGLSKECAKSGLIFYGQKRFEAKVKTGAENKNRRTESLLRQKHKNMDNWLISYRNSLIVTHIKFPRHGKKFYSYLPKHFPSDAGDSRTFFLEFEAQV